MATTESGLNRPADVSSSNSPIVERLTITGQVQGVGFRPFVYRIARRFALHGWVQNRQGQVVIQVTGPEQGIESFVHALTAEAPPLARPILESRQQVESEPYDDFQIRSSCDSGLTDIHVPPDQFTCDDCLRELNTPSDRRYRYPFINCTQCGPRYTLIEKLPYDRPNTSMAGFPLCSTCRSEYENPLDRRFHAEPVACPDCGPQLHFKSEKGEIANTPLALNACVEALRNGSIVAVKGIGGYHLLCDARNSEAIERLRQRKHRPHKPLAVMFPATNDDGLSTVREELDPGTEEGRMLANPARPIVLCRKHHNSTLAEAIAPGLNVVGAMLPYSPLHHLLLNDFGGPLVATSGNISGEPVLADNAEAEKRLAQVADAFLHHDRPILRPADDALYRVIGKRARPLRLGRGIAPLELVLPFGLSAPTLAVGGQMKNSVALAWENRVIISPHIGDLDSPRSLRVFEQVIADLQHLYGIKVERLVCDSHPNYAASHWARQQEMTLTEVFHHHAHASGLYGEHAGEGEWLVFTWDGVGYGDDGTLWGGEALFGHPGNWQRFASLRPFRLPGGEKAGREPWRSALACCWEAGVDWPDAPDGHDLLQQAWEKDINSPQTTAAGRLFDAASALLGLCQHASFEGQGPMWLEAVSNTQGDAIGLPLNKDNNGLWITDWSPLLPHLMDNTTTILERAGLFHTSLADTILRQARMAREQFGIADVGLSGGVFQNRLLCELAVAKLQLHGFTVHMNESVPTNDGGLCYGQIIEHISL